MQKRDRFPTRPRLADGLELIPGPGDLVQLRGVHPPVRLSGALAQGLLPLLDGSRTLLEIRAALGGWPAEQVHEALQALNDRGLLAGGKQGRSNSSRGRSRQVQSAFYRSVTRGSERRGEEILQTFRQSKVHLFGWGALLTGLTQALRAAGHGQNTVESWAPTLPAPEEFEQRLAERERADLVVLALPRPAPALLRSANTACLEAGIPLFPVVINHVEATLGPTLMPGQSACYECFTARVMSNHMYPAEEAAYQAHLDRPSSARALLPEWPPFTYTVAHWAVMEIVRLVTGFAPPTTVGRVQWLDALSGSQRTARVWKLPRCPACACRQPPQGGDDSPGC